MDLIYCMNSPVQSHTEHANLFYYIWDMYP